MRRKLGWGEATAIERLLIERVVQTWLQLQLLEMADAQSPSCSLELDKHQQEKTARAERRHLSAIKMLAQVRKMALPLRIDLTGSLTQSMQRKHPAARSRVPLLRLLRTSILNPMIRWSVGIDLNDRCVWSPVSRSQVSTGVLVSDNASPLSTNS